VKASRCSLFPPLSPHIPSFCGANPFTSSSSLSWGRALKHALFLPVEIAECGQELLGHTEISMTMDTYAHILPSMQQKAMHKMNMALWG
jgi:hypothetical protein